MTLECKTQVYVSTYTYIQAIIVKGKSGLAFEEEKEGMHMRVSRKENDGENVMIS